MHIHYTYYTSHIAQLGCYIQHIADCKLCAFNLMAFHVTMTINTFLAFYQYPYQVTVSQAINAHTGLSITIPITISKFRYHGKITELL